MGLDTSHDCWHGSYSTFMRWREAIAHAVGFPPLQLMKGFYVPFKGAFSWDLPTLYYGTETYESEHLRHIDKLLPISWECLKPHPLISLLHHSDCEGCILLKDCEAIANELEKLLPNLSEGQEGIDNWKQRTQKFIEGLRLAVSLGEDVEFH